MKEFAAGFEQGDETPYWTWKGQQGRQKSVWSFMEPQFISVWVQPGQCEGWTRLFHLAAIDILDYIRIKLICS